MIQQMLAIWSMVPLPFLKPVDVYKFLLHIMLKPSIQDDKCDLTSKGDECNCLMISTFFGTTFLGDWDEDWPLLVLWPLLGLTDLWTYWVQHFDIIILLEKAMAPHSSTLAWKIPWMEEPGRLQSMGSLRVGHDWANSLSLFTFMHGRRKWQPTPVFLPGESQGRGSLVGCRLWGCRVGHDWSDLAAAMHIYWI